MIEQGPGGTEEEHLPPTPNRRYSDRSTWGKVLMFAQRYVPVWIVLLTILNMLGSRVLLSLDSFKEQQAKIERNSARIDSLIAINKQASAERDTLLFIVKSGMRLQCLELTVRERAALGACSDVMP